MYFNVYANNNKRFFNLIGLLNSRLNTCTLIESTSKNSTIVKKADLTC